MNAQRDIRGVIERCMERRQAARAHPGNPVLTGILERLASKPIRAVERTPALHVEDRMHALVHAMRHCVGLNAWLMSIGKRKDGLVAAIRRSRSVRAWLVRP